MPAKLAARNQIALPKAAVSAVDAAEYFNVQVENGRIMLTPARDQLQRLGTSEQDVADAIAWARRVKIKQMALVTTNLGGNERIHYNKLRY
ncbi:AbrB/MazE/SpoVT family DNA-binding domain-containing protein [Vandammella animalimorsus]|uniref:AbrB/MazE/SpoVT family DNA-binding domain-containing protein n=1 Tax=Vandammella animalimorsus TaxID=2029117 RepID=UPI001EEE298D|nr:AbrB/MazE/SpoVT family DNA-binding domain-containing protein [Vandammella animalimorsus]